MRSSNRFQFAIAGAVLLGAALVMAGAGAQLPPGTVLPAPPAATSSPSASSSPSSFLEAFKNVPPEFLVVIDPGHGGDDKGAMLAGGKVAEKDVSLVLARELKRQLEDRGVAARLLRDSDVNLSLERRAAITNEEHAALYVALHAGQPGKGVRVYAPSLAQPPLPAVGRFLPWDGAQAGSLERSRAVAKIVASEVGKTGLPVAGLAAPLRPLNNLITPAIAVEWAPGSEELRPPQVQKVGNTLAAAIASGIVQARSKGAELR